MSRKGEVPHRHGGTVCGPTFERILYACSDAYSRMRLKIKKRLGLLSSNFFSVAPAGPESTPPEPLTHQLYGKINIEPGDAV